ncbi:MAG: carboxymuconolactone decarboxylase family protein [Chitinophagales bacterium]|nr:carboxymuconolactone decarboxylase family protein [Chitinophagales bacterium]
MEQENTTLTVSIQSMFAELGIDETHTSKSLESLSAVDSKYLRDLKLNVAAVMKSKNLSARESALLALAVSVTEKNNVLITAFENMSRKAEATAEEIAEAHACASLLSLNNVFYRFRHYMHGNEYYNNTPAGIRMSIMMNPVLGKEFFELMSIVVSAINGCEQCMVSHEHSVKALGTTEPRIYDAVRLGAVIRSLSVIV